jgi:hypothetical protein
VKALTYYWITGLAAYVFPLVVCIRDMTDLSLSLSYHPSMLKFLEIHKKHWQTAAEKILVALVRVWARHCAIETVVVTLVRMMPT